MPIKLSLDVKNPDNIAYSGKDLDTELAIKNPDGTKKELETTYTIYDSRDNILTTEKEKITLEKDQELAKAIKIPRLANPGRYRAEAKIRYGDHVISAESFFEIKEIPILNLGAGITVTLTQIMQKISWVIIVLLLVLLIFLLLLGFEHHVTKRALLHITENILQQKNIISGGKGVSG